MNYAIILSGGTGTRAGLKIPKQYHKLNGRPMIEYVLDTINACDFIDGFIIVAAEEWKPFIKERIAWDNKRFLGFALPGKNRQLSIYNGMKLLMSNVTEDDIVLIHEAARPYTTVELIRECFNLKADEDGAMPVLPMKETVYISKDGKSVSSLINRSHVFAGQAPESFRIIKYFEAIEDLLPDKIHDINGSTEPAILAGMNIKLIPGDERNIKITTKEDLKNGK